MSAPASLPSCMGCTRKHSACLGRAAGRSLTCAFPGELMHVTVCKTCTPPQGSPRARGQQLTASGARLHPSATTGSEAALTTSLAACSTSGKGWSAGDEGMDDWRHLRCAQGSPSG